MRSNTCASPVMSLPSTMGTPVGNPLGSGLNCGRLTISRNETTARRRLGTSMPTACFPGIGATIRTRDAASRSAMLSARLTMREILTPGAGNNSNMVITGPRRMPVTSASILNSASVAIRVVAASRVSLSTCHAASGS